MRKAGMNWFQGFLLSITNLASAGEYADTQVIAEDAAYIEIVLATFVANMRYVLMSTALSQRLKPHTRLIHRCGIAYGITDEIFAIAIAQDGDVPPSYMYGAAFIAAPAWAIGTAVGILAGSLLPGRIVSALSAALYGMFLAIIIPPCKKDKAVCLAVVLSFLASWLCSVLPVVRELSSGMRTIILTVVIASIFAVLMPHKEEKHDA
jgi:predicted branched-subunit amino acid permease